MTLPEAVRLSMETGRRFRRPWPHWQRASDVRVWGEGQRLIYYDGHQYEDRWLPRGAGDILATDYELVPEGEAPNAAKDGGGE